jgi:hypothetical protein
LKLAAVILLIDFVACPVHAASTADSQPGSVCVAPIRENPPLGPMPEYVCSSGKRSLRIDNLPAIPWPHEESVKIDNLALAEHHQGVILCDGKPQQSFKFRFAEFKTARLCLTLNDLYGWAQLWDAKRSPWCKCKASLEHER